MPKAKQRKIPSAFAMLVIISLATLGFAQQPPAKQSDQDDVLRVKTDLVQVRAVVTDKQGKLVENLKQEDFEILENNRPQTISFFNAAQVPSESAGPTAPTKKTETPEEPSRPLPAARPVRTIVLFVDTLHLTPVSLIRAKQQLKQFVDEKMTDQDMAAVVTTSNSLGVLQQFMRDRRMLKYAIDKITLFVRPSSFFTPYLAARVLESGFVPGAMTEAMQVASSIMANEEWGGVAPPPSVILGRAKQILEEESLMRRATLLTIKGVSDRMADLPGQRMLAFVSDGFTMLGENGSAEHEDFNDATSRAVRSGVVIYSFSPQGLQAPVEFSARAPMLGVAFGNMMHDTELDQQQTLRDVAHVTGGEAYLNSNDVVGQFKKMLDANRVYYALAYYPQAETDKKFRNIKLRVKNHPEYHIRTQSGYQPSNEKKSAVATTPQQKLFELMVAPLPTTAIGVTSAADYLERTGDDNQVTLLVHFDGELLEYARQDQKHLLACEVAVVVFDHEGKTAQSFSETITAAFTAEQLEKAKHNGYRYVKRLKLAPNLYQIRIGVRDVNGSLMGTSTSWATVPDLQKKRLTLSNIFLGKEKQDDQAAIMATADKSAKPSLISGQASFKHTEPVFYRCVLYNSTAAGAVTDNLQVRVEVLESGTSAYDGSWQPLASRIIRSDGLGMEIGGQLKLDVPPGIYTLRITVRDQKSKKDTQQTVSFEIDS